MRPQRGKVHAAYIRYAPVAILPAAPKRVEGILGAGGGGGGGEGLTVSMYRIGRFCLFVFLPRIPGSPDEMQSHPPPSSRHPFSSASLGAVLVAGGGIGAVVGVAVAVAVAVGVGV